MRTFATATLLAVLSVALPAAAVNGLVSATIVVPVPVAPSSTSSAAVSSSITCTQDDGHERVTVSFE